MPAGLGKFEGEGFATWILYNLSLDSAQDDTAGSVDTFGWHALFQGSIPREDIDPKVIQEGEESGRTPEEVDDGLRWLEQMQGAILGETSQGFVWSVLYSEGDRYNGQPGLEHDWRELVEMDSEVEQ